LKRRQALEAAQHEAAHVVVGVALGLHLSKASARAWTSGDADGWTWFPAPPNRCEWAYALMTAAGVAWERKTNPKSWRWHAKYDWEELLGAVPGKHDAEACVRAATSMLAGLAAVHARVARALLEKDLTGADISAIAHGERLSDE
jgi:hypothetical protein